MAAMTPQAALSQRLSALLGFEEVDDVLEHLLSIESSQVCCAKRMVASQSLLEACLGDDTGIVHVRLTLQTASTFAGSYRLLITAIGKKRRSSAVFC